MFVSYVDESGKGGPIFVLAGLLSTPERWIAFSEEWQRILDMPPKTDVFKFSGYNPKSPQALKMPLYIEAINKYAERMDVTILHSAAFTEAFGGVLGVSFDTPFHAGYMQLIIQCAELSRRKYPRQKIDFVFDEMEVTEYIELVSAYRRFKEISNAPEVNAVLGSDPVMKDDTVVLPLQAADLIAGAMRRAFEERDEDSANIIESITVENQGIEMDKDHVRRLREFTHSKAPLSPELYEGKKERSKRLRGLRKWFKETFGKA